MSQTIQVGCDIRPSADFRKLTSTTLQQDKDDVGSLCRQQRIAVYALGVIQFADDTLALRIIHKVISHIIGGSLLERSKEIEHGVDSRMV